MSRRSSSQVDKDGNGYWALNVDPVIVAKTNGNAGGADMVRMYACMVAVTGLSTQMPPFRRLVCTALTADSL